MEYESAMSLYILGSTALMSLYPTKVDVSWIPECGNDRDHTTVAITLISSDGVKLN